MENLENWRKAGKIAAQALEYGRGLITNGAVIREVCDKIDAKIVELGAIPAWPTQIGLDDVAAHQTPDHDDETVFDKNVVCLDVGAHVNGCVGDNATSVDLSGEYSDIIKASEQALKAAMKLVAPGTKLGEIGHAIQETIQGFDLKPVRNLCGHGISQWVIHDKPSIPNYDTKDTRELKDGQVIAIEPFATNGAGMIVEADRANLFSMESAKPVRSPYARELQTFIKQKYNTLPFTSRWIVKQFGAGKTSLAINELLRNGSLHPYPPLVEKDGGMVTVFEKTFLVGEKLEVLTKSD
ncbi:type II methionyl aminopeptidase [Candidatus Woesearchaeota archaeon]|nr:type II methionyl aminopeptidase [Candidatus Woesearchaeota archaeon]